MDIIELTKKTVEIANQDEGLREKVKNTVVTITMLLKNNEELPLTISIDKGELKLIKGSWAEINKIATPLSAIPKFGKEIAQKEGMWR